jgi:PAS domain S-box-containing protein
MGNELGRIVDALPGLVWTALPDGQIEFLNQRWSDYTGFPADECRGEGWQAVVHPDDLPGLLAGWRPESAAAAPVETPARLRGQDGKYRWFLFSAHPSADASGHVVKWSGLGTDIDERVHAETALREERTWAEALLAGEKRLLEMVAGGRPMPEILGALCRFVESTVSGCYCSIVLLDSDGAKLQEAIAPSLAAEFNDPVRGWPLTRVGGPCVMAARDKTQVIMSDVSSDTRWRNEWRALAHKHDLTSCWSTPIVSRAGNVLGTFALYRSEPGTPNALQLELIEQFRNIASIAIERAQRDEALHRSEARLAATERELQLTIDTLPILIATYRPNGSRIFVNQTWRDYTGISLEEAEQISVVHPDDAERVALEWRTSLAAGAPLTTEARLRRADGTYRWHAMHRVLARDEAGAIAKMYNVAVDIEERKRAEEALRDSEQDSRLIVDSIPGLVAVYTPDGDFEFVNRQVVEYFGRTLDDLKAKRGKSREGLHPEDFPRVTALFKQSIASGEPFDFEVRCRRFDGVYRWFQSRGFPLRDANGRIVRWYNLLIDIDERRRAEDALRQSEARLSQAEGELRLTLDSIPVITWRGAPNGYVEQLNKRWFEYTGATPEQTRGRRWKSWVHPDDLDPLVEAGTRYVAGETPVDMEARLRRFDGTYRWFLFRPAPARDETGNIVGWYGTIIDIEDRKQAEQKAIEAERDLQHMIDHIPTMVATYRGDGSRLSINKRLRDYLGPVPAADWARALRRTAVLDIHPDDVKDAEDKWRECLATGEPFQGEFRVRRYDGTYRWIMRHRVPVRDESGKIIRWYGVGYEIEDRKRAEDELRRSEALLAKAQQLSLTGSFSFNPATEEATWSEEVYRIHEYPPGARATLAMVRARYHPEDLQLLEEQVARIRSGATDLDYEHRLMMPDGSIKHVHMIAHGSRDKDSGAIEYIGAVQDVTQRKRAEEELRRSEAFLAKAQRLSLTGSFSFHSKAFTWSEELYRIFEFEPGVPINLELIATRYHPEDRHIMEQVAEGIQRGAPDFDYEHRLLMPDGSIKHIHVVAQGAPDKEGEGLEYFGAVQDVTQRRVAEEGLRRSQAYLAEAQRLAHTGSWAIDYANRRPIHSSEELYRLFGFDPAAGMPSWNEWRERVHPEDREMARDIVKQSSREKTGFEMDYRVCHPDGTIKHLHVVGHPVLNAAGEVAEFVGTSVDVTQRRLAEEELRRSEAYLAEAQRLSHTGSWVVDYANRKPIHSSDEHHRLFGFDPANGIPPWRDWMDRIHPEDRPRTKEIIERSTREKTDLEMDYRICHPDGAVRYVHDVGHPVLNAAGDVVEFIGTSVDVTQRRLAEDALDKARSELAHVTRVMSLGALTASIAHEVNQPLSGIITNASTCLRMLAADPPNIAGARMTAQRTIRDGNRAADVITRLRALFSKKPAATETVDLNEATREVLALAFSDLLRNRVYLRTELDDDHPLLVTGDRVQLQQVILNLVRNASDAMRDVNDRPRHLLVKLEREEEGGARLLVKDAGVGLEPQNIDRLFDAFYTTKSDGMGIGLSVSRSIIESHGGKLWAEANDGPGTTFLFSIPASTDAATDDRIGGSVWTHQLNNGRDAMRNP